MNAMAHWTRQDDTTDHSMRRARAVLWPLIAGCATQALLDAGHPLPAAGLFLTALLCALTHPGSIRIRSRAASPVFDAIRVSILWLCAIAIRTHRITEFHKIDELSARYSLVALDFMRGVVHFPFIPKYEFDESLVGFLIVPWFEIFGISWDTIKLFSILTSSLLIPAAFLLLRRTTGSEAAIGAGSLLVLSEYFQKTDPIFGMLRFTLLAIAMIAILRLIDRLDASSRYATRATMLVLLNIIGLYIHSYGRLLPIYTTVLLFLKFPRMRGTAARRPGVVVAVLWVISLAAIGHLLWEIHQHPGYVFFKGRQVLGRHEQYPLTWELLVHSCRSVIENLNYRATLHQMFSPDFPLFRRATGILFLGGLIALLAERPRRDARRLLAAFAFTALPLCALTPGPWRGVYFAPLVAFATLIAGRFLGLLAVGLFGFRRGLPDLALATFILLLGLTRVPGFFSSPFAPGTIQDQNTLLFRDLESAGSEPYFFSRNLEQCLPDLAIFELTRGARLSEYYVFMTDPLRFMDGYESECAIRASILNGRGAVFVLAGSDRRAAETIRAAFPDAVTGRLKQSRLQTFRIPQRVDAPDIP